MIDRWCWGGGGVLDRSLAQLVALKLGPKVEEEWQEPWVER